MTLDVQFEGATIGVIGAGAMGRGIAQVALQGGLEVLLYDAMPGAAERGREFVSGMLDRAVEKRRLEGAAAARMKQSLRVAESIAALAPARLVVEAVIEDLEVKRKVFKEVEAVVAEDAVIASNTSSIRIASIAAACERKDRIAGLHFFNPVPLMALVEIVRAPATSAATIEVLTQLSRRMGRVPVTVQDSPGFLVNLGGRAFTTEALRIVSERAARPQDVDAVMRETCGFRMGPFELMDLTGLDVNFPVSLIIYNGYFHDRRLATSPPHQAMAESGRLGRKTRAGWYDYDEAGNPIGLGDEPDRPAAPAPAVVLAEPHSRLAGLFREAGAEVLEQDDKVSPLIAGPVGEDCTAVALRLGLDSSRLVAVDLTGTIDRRLTVMAAPGADPSNLAGVANRLKETGAKVTCMKDCPGFIAQRIQAMIANLGAEMAQIGIAEPADIDVAMKLGLNYPQGPLELADAMGPGTVLQILTRLQAITGDDRYRPSQWLRRRALLGLPMHTPD